MNPPPKITVLLATHDGAKYVAKQLDTIFSQSNILVNIVVSDDSSLDGTECLITHRAESDCRIHLLQHNLDFGSAGKNFYHLLQQAEIQSYDYIAFADQDDIWNQDKLKNQADLIEKHRAEGVSSNVMAFWPNGKQRLIKKAQPQRELDYLFESAGPGCTFLMTPSLVRRVCSLLADTSSPARDVALHDWLCYAVCRAYGGTWYIDPQPTVLYRQHANNVVGANSGFKPKITRLRKLRNGWYRAEVLKIAKICQAIRPNDQYVDLIALLEQPSFLNRFRLLAFVPQARRKFSDRCWLALAILLGAF